MRTIKLHLAQTEYDAVERYATLLRTTPEAIAYVGLNRLMHEAQNPKLRKEIIETWQSHADDFPVWSEVAQADQRCGGKPDRESVPSP